MRWSTFYSASLCLYVKPISEYFPYDQATDYRLRVKLISALGDKFVTDSFFELLHSTLGCKCADPRDRVYALLGLAPSFDKKIAPDYKRSVFQIYQKIVLKYEDSFKNVNILTAVEMPRESSWGSICRGVISSLSRRIAIPQVLNVPSWAPSPSPTIMPALLRYSDAGGGTLSWIQYPGSGALKVAGVLEETIQTTNPISIHYTDSIDHLYTEHITPLYEVVKKSDNQHRRNTSIDTFCRTLTADGFAELFYPPATNLPNLELSKVVLSAILGLPDAPRCDEETFDRHRKYLGGAIREYVNNRSFFVTKNGKIGLGPQSTKPGDHICIFLGCHSPMLLRPASRGQFRVVGEAFFNDACFGQAFFGPIPDGYEYRWCMQYDDKTGSDLGFKSSIINSSTLEQLAEDPRLGPLPSGWKSTMETPFDRVFWKTGDESYTYSDPRLTPEALEKRGIAIRYFELI
jgi:hypothetical protein